MELFLDVRLYGLISAPFIGSFLGLVAVRWPLGEQVVKGRSACRACGFQLQLCDLIPLIGFFLIGGRCRNCSVSIDKIYPVVELAALLVAIWAACLTDGVVFILSCVLGWTLVLISALDWREMWIPDWLTVPLSIIGVLGAGLWISGTVFDLVLGVVVGFAVFWGIGSIYRRFRGHDGLGLGDAKLLAAGGAWVGWQGLPAVVVWASVSALATFFVRARGRKLSYKDPVPFGPFLALGIWVTWMHGPLEMWA